MTEKVAGTLPHRREEVFDLAADIERYPEYMPGWIAARIQQREADGCRVRQVLGFGPLRLEFTSRATFHRPERIDVASTDPPFRRYTLAWRFAPAPSGCHVSIEADFQMQSGVLQLAADRLLPAAIRQVITAFEARACALYGSPGRKDEPRGG